MIHAPVTDAAPLLASALRRSAAAAGIAVDVVSVDERPWASLTFTGARHRLTLAADAGRGFDEWLTAIGSAMLRMRGHVAGEPALIERRTIAGRCHATLDVVTIKDG